jgi:hypothetical protein
MLRQVRRDDLRSLILAESPERSTDQAALLGVALAATVSISAADGPWEPIESIVGIVLLSVVVAYFDFSRSHLDGQTWVRPAALASVLGLCWCLVIAWPLQQLGMNTYWWLPVCWIVVAIVIFGLLRPRHARSRR